MRLPSLRILGTLGVLMPVTIGELTTDVIAEAEQAAAAAETPDKPENDAAAVRARIAATAGQTLRTRAEGFDD